MTAAPHSGGWTRGLWGPEGSWRQGGTPPPGAEASGRDDLAAKNMEEQKAPPHLHGALWLGVGSGATQAHTASRVDVCVVIAPAGGALEGLTGAPARPAILHTRAPACTFLPGKGLSSPVHIRSCSLPQTSEIGVKAKA